MNPDIHCFSHEEFEAGCPFCKIVELAHDKTKAERLLDEATQILRAVAKCDGWLRTDETRELWERLEAWEKKNPCP